MNTPFRTCTFSPAIRAATYKGVIERLHKAIAAIQTQSILGTHEGWMSMEAMLENQAALQSSLDALLGGEQLETTQRATLFAMRELVLAGNPNFLMDGRYVVPGKNIVLSVGPLTVNVRRDSKGVDIIVSDSPQESNSTKARFPFPALEVAECLSA